MVKPTRDLRTDARPANDSSERSNGADVSSQAVQTDSPVGESARTSVARVHTPVRFGRLELWAGGHANIRLDLACQLDGNSKAAYYRGTIVGFDERTNGCDIGHVEAVVTRTFGLSPRDVLEEEFWPLYSKSGSLVRAADRLVDAGEIYPGAIFLTHLTLISEARGHGLGHHIVERLLDVLAVNCGYAVLRAAPHRESTVQHTSDSATVALVNYWQKIDFVRVEGMDLMVRDLAYEPTFKLRVPHCC